MSRRDTLALGGAAMAAAATGAQAKDGMAIPEPALEFVFALEVAVGPPQELGEIDGMRKRIIPITGGRITGPRLGGIVMSGGADWQDIRPSDGLTRVFAHYWLKADDGAMISVKNNGIRRAGPEAMKRLMAGEIVPPADYYFRTAPQFDTGAAAHRWLNENLFICVGARLPDKVLIRTYLVK